MKNIVKKIALLGVLTLVVCGAQAQINPVTTTAPSLAIAPDARAGGMGDAGVATAPDIYSQHWNPAKYAFHPSKAGFALSYTPWLRKIVNDINLVHGVGYYKIGNSDNQAISASIRYFSVGDVTINRVQDGNNMGGYTIAPYEMAIDVAYSRKLTSTFSGSVAFRYIRADYSGADEEGSAGSAFAADIAGYNESYINLGNTESLLSFGFNISNIGSKLSNNDGRTSSFLPTNLRVGASLMLPVSEVSTLSFSVDVNKLLVPTPPVMREGETIAEFEDRKQKYYDISPIKGMFRSFTDAPGGFKEEVKEVSASFGVEYDYNNMFKARTGYFHESKMKGNRRYFTFGAGFKFKAFQLDAAYLLSTANASPLDQTLRLSLGFDIDGLKNMFR